MAGGRRAAGAAALAVALLLGASAPARAHVVMGARTLRALVADAAWALRAEITEAAPDRLAPDARGAHGARPAVQARVLEVLKAPTLGAAAGGRADPTGAHAPTSPLGTGDPAGAEPLAPGDTVRFAQHGHGVAEHRPGEQVLLFLRPLASVPELRALASEPGAPPWVSLQGHGERWRVEGAGSPAVAAVRAYARALDETDPPVRTTALRQLTLELLASPDPRLAASALRDVALAGDALFGPGEAPALLALVARPDVAVGVRIGLLAELARRGQVDDAPARWVALLRATDGRDRVAVVRALAAHPSPEVAAALAPLLEGDDAAAAEAAAVSLGAPGQDAAVTPLARALAEGPERLRMAAIRGLGGVATPAAREALAAAAGAHPDPATRRRAAAELRRLGAPTP